MNPTCENTRCCYREHICSRTRFENYKFCFEHMLADENSPFTSCEYISRTSNRKCPNPALRQRKSDDIPVLCNDHFQDLIAKERHHKQKKRMRKKKKSEKRISEQKIRKERKGLINHVLKRGNGMPSSSQRSHAIDSSDSDVYEEVHRPITDDWPLESLDDLKNDANWDDFDPVNNEVYEPLRYADVLTPEEVVATAQSKLIRLQSLYLEQFKRLFYVLKERRRDYLHEQKKEEKEEKSGKAGSSNMESDPAQHQKMMELFNYRKRKGVEILLRRKQKKKRMESGSGTSNYPPEQAASQQRCAHASNHARCKSSCLPYTKYCSEHILEDPHQLLYRKCCMNNCHIAVCHLISRPYKEKIEGDTENKNLGGQTEEKSYCMLHAPLPEMTFKMPKEILKGYEPEMEVETSTDVSQPTDIEQVLHTETKMDADSLPLESNMQISENPSICKPEAIKEQAPPSQELESTSALPQQAKDELVGAAQDDSAISDVGPNISASKLKLDAGDTEPEQEVTNMDVDEKQGVEQSSEAKVTENTDASEQSEITVTAAKESIIEKIELEEYEPSLQFQPLVEKKVEDNVFAEKEPSLPCEPSGEEKLGCKAHSEPLCTVGEKNKREVLDTIPPNFNDESNAETEGMSDSNISKSNEDRQSVENADNEESKTERDDLPNTNNNSSKDADIKSDIILEENSDKNKTNNEPANDNLKTVQEETEEKEEGKVPEESHSVLESDDSTLDNLDSELGKEESEDATKQSSLTSLTPMLEQMTSRMGERKPSSADEEMAVVSLLSLCSASHHSDENFSSSAEQDELQL